jgi:hypothetical protein
MLNLIGRSVNMVRLAEVTHVFGLGQIGPAIDANASGAMGVLSLVRSDGGVYVEGKSKDGKPLCFEIPIGNIKIIIYDQPTPK